MEITNISIRANSIYPEINNANNDPRIVAILKDLLSSRQGELVGVLQYIYQSRISQQIEPDFSAILEEIAIVEMQHVELLMDAIIDFGGLPKYENSRGQSFNTNYINYSSKLKDILDVNIQGEQQAISDYTNAQRMVGNESLKNLLGRIVEDEQLHLNAFKHLRNTVKFLSI